MIAGLRVGGKKRISALLLAGVMAFSLTGCAEQTDVVRPEDVELLEPVGVAINYETAAYRDLYDAKVYNALICPYVEEYSMDKSMPFDRYAVLPGQEVSRGQTVIQTDTESLDEQIKEMEERIADQKKSYQEAMDDANEALREPRDAVKVWETTLANWEKEKPAEGSAKYASWEETNQKYEAEYHKALIRFQKGQEASRQRTGLYELDLAYNELCLKRLREDKSNQTLVSGMDGVVTSARLFVKGEWMQTDQPLVAVGDLERKVLRSEYVNKTEINSAEAVYAIINGKRYDVEYVPMEVEEYKKLYDSNNGKVFSSFYLQGDISDVEMGGYGVIVVVRRSRRSVLTIPKDSITREDGNASVYVVKDNESVYTPVRTGMDDGLYTEILSGLEEGDKILTGQAPLAAKKTAKLAKGSISSSFSDRGYLSYPARAWITNPIEYGTAYLEECLVHLNQQVQKGDVLARIRVTADNVELARNEKKLQREKERIAELRKDAERNKRAIEAKEKVIAELEKVISKMKQDFATTEIVAPYDGIATSANEYYNVFPIGRLKEGDMLSKDQQLFMLAEAGSNYIVVEDENGILTYGNQVTISYRSAGGGNAAASGTVVSLNPYSVSDILFSSGGTLVKVSAEDIGNMAGSARGGDDYWSRSRFNISATIRKMDNVLLVPKKAVVVSAGLTYVKLAQENGEVLLQSFVAGGSDGSNYWVAEGLTEGMEVCIE